MYKEKKVFTSSMIQTLINANRKSITSGEWKELDSFSVVAQMLPIPFENVDEDSFNKFKWEVELLQATKSASFDDGFLPALSSFEYAQDYMISCWNKLGKMKGYSPARTLSDIIDPEVIRTVTLYCEYPALIGAICSHMFRDTTDLTKLNELIKPTAERRETIIQALEKAESYRELIKITHSILFTKDEIKQHLKTLTCFDLSGPHYVIYESWLHDDIGNKVKKLQEYSYPLTAFSVLNLSDSNPNDVARGHVHNINMQAVSKVVEEIKLQELAATKEANRLQAEADVKAHTERVEGITERVANGSATYKDLQEYLSW